MPFNRLTGSVVFIIFIALFSCKKDPDPQPVSPPTSSNLIKGADVSWVTEMEAAGKKFYNNAGVEQDCFTLLKSLGMNGIRLRAWVNPAGNWNNKQDLLSKAIRAKNNGMKIMIDFHYSDTWADPGHQDKPQAWQTLSFAELKSALYYYTSDVLSSLKSNGISPDWVQVGNETNNGMLWPDGKASVSMSNFAQLINSGYDAVKAVFPATKVIVHISNGYDNGLFRWIFDGLKNNGAKWDVIGLSLYPSPANWQTLNSQCLTNMNDMVARYNTEVMVVEAGMSWDQAPICKSFLEDLLSKVSSVSGNKGLGVFYWEPEAYGNWKGYTLGAFDNSGRPTIALNAFN
ncbi:MAG: arabinogalactan endo-beta-1,4-galactanase [Candidatus Dadabacteria bacterium]